MVAQFDFKCDGLVAQHNFPCPVCTKAPAVYNVNEGVFQPCWGCQETGWKTEHTNPNKYRWVFDWISQRSW